MHFPELRKNNVSENDASESVLDKHLNRSSNLEMINSSKMLDYQF